MPRREGLFLADLFATLVLNMYNATVEKLENMTTDQAALFGCRRCITVRTNFQAAVCIKKDNFLCLIW